LSTLTLDNYTDEDVELCQLLSSNKKKRSQKEVNGEMQKIAKRKRYHPKVVSQFPEIAKNFPESSGTLKSATPKQRKNYVVKTKPNHIIKFRLIYIFISIIY